MRDVCKIGDAVHAREVRQDKVETVFNDGVDALDVALEEVDIERVAGNFTAGNIDHLSCSVEGKDMRAKRREVEGVLSCTAVHIEHAIATTDCTRQGTPHHIALGAADQRVSEHLVVVARDAIKSLACSGDGTHASTSWYVESSPARALSMRSESDSSTG